MTHPRKQMYHVTCHVIDKYELTINVLMMRGFVRERGVGEERGRGRERAGGRGRQTETEKE